MTASLWRDRRFVRFWTGQTVSQFGDRVSELAVPLIAVGTLHATAAQVARLTALAWTPNLLAVFLGAWVDRRPGERALMVAADLVRAALLLTLPLAALAGAVTLGQLYAVALLTGLAGVVFGTAYSSFFPRLVPPPSYVDANSKLSASCSASFVAGPALGGGLVQLLTAPVAVAVDAVSFLVSALLVGRVHADEPRVTGRPDGPALLRGAREGLAFVVRHPVLRPTLACATTLNFFTFLTGTGLLVLFADRELGLSPGVIGLAFGAGAIGGLLGAVAAPAISRAIGVGRSVAVGAVLFPAPFALVWAAEGPPWARAGVLAAAELLSSFGVMLFDVNLNSLQTAVVPDGLRSRVAGAYSTVNYGVRPLGALVGGALATLVGLRPTITVAAVGGALSLLWLLPSPIPGTRTLDDIAVVAPGPPGRGPRPPPRRPAPPRGAPGRGGIKNR
ncbi:MFS transporter, partial [Streptomyces sp. NPDC058964]|uniref:MFS transporter n=1 Tax=Streptomyces sp. NPDC058964 TaxID=3346681 RepID=UPI0036844230